MRRPNRLLVLILRVTEHHQVCEGLQDIGRIRSILATLRWIAGGNLQKY